MKNILKIVVIGIVKLMLAMVGGIVKTITFHIMKRNGKIDVIVEDIYDLIKDISDSFGRR